MSRRSEIDTLKAGLALPGVGIDVVEVARIHRAWQRHGERFLRRVFTAREIEYCLSQPHPERHFAARFAAKEAASKCLGTGIGGGVEWIDLEVLRAGDAAPRLQFHRRAAALARRHGLDRLQLSLTHSDTLAAAAVAAPTITPLVQAADHP